MPEDDSVERAMTLSMSTIEDAGVISDMLLRGYRFHTSSARKQARQSLMLAVAEDLLAKHADEHLLRGDTEGAEIRAICSRAISKLDDD